MTVAQPIIDLSLIPVPDAVEVPDAFLLLAELIEKYRELDAVFDALVESDPTYKLSEAFSWRVVLLRQRVNDAVRAVLLASARKNDLDQVCAGLEVSRKVVKPEDLTTFPPTPAEMESDEELRARAQLSWGRLSTAGAEDSYHYFALSADSDVLDARAYGPETHEQEGRVFLYVLSRTGSGIAPQALLDKVAEAVKADDIRPLTDFVSVRSTELREYRVDADIYIPYGVDGSLVMSLAQAKLDEYIEQVHRIGGIAARSGIDGALHQPGAVRVVIRQPAEDVLSEMGQTPWCSSVSIQRVVMGHD